MPWSWLEGSVGDDQQNRPGDVRRLATALQKAGYLPPDDDHSHSYLTRPLVNAVTSYQSDNSLPRDGIVMRDGPTAGSLFGLAADGHEEKPSEAKPSDRRTFHIDAPVGDGLKSNPEDVARVKAGLLLTGDLDEAATSGPPGLLDGGTIDGVKRFQERNGLRADGWLNPGGESAEKLDAELRAHVEPANLRMALRIFGWLGGRRLRSFLEQTFSDGYYWALRNGRDHLSRTRTLPNGFFPPWPENPLPVRPAPRALPPATTSADRRGGEPGRPTPPGFPANPPIKPAPQSGRPAQPPIKDLHKPPEPEEPPKLPDREELRYPELRWGDFVLVLPEPDADLRGPFVVEMRGKPKTRAYDGGVGRQTMDPIVRAAKDYPGLEWKHLGGGHVYRSRPPKELKQRHVKPPDYESRQPKTNKDSTFPDLSFWFSYKGVEWIINVNTHDRLADLGLTGREKRQIEKLEKNKKIARLNVALPKLKSGEYLDKAVYQRYIYRVIQTIIRGIDDDPDAAKAGSKPKFQHFRKIRRRSDRRYVRRGENKK